MTENITKLDELKQLADGTENDDKSIFSFYEALLDTELYLLLEKDQIRLKLFLECHYFF